LKNVFRNITVLLLLIFISGIILITSGIIDISFNDIAINSVVFALISTATLIIFFKGQAKEPMSQMFHSLAAVSSKLLLEMGFALIWFIVIKKTELELVLLFFVLYLTFTLFSVFIILKTLKNKSLENKP
jgi:hypothetical protein